MTTSNTPGEFEDQRSRHLLAAIVLALLIALAIFLCLWIGTPPQAAIWAANANSNGNTVQVVCSHADPRNRSGAKPAIRARVLL